MTPRTTNDPDGDKRRALRQAATAAARARAAEAAAVAAMRFAQDRGASLREIALATQIPHATVRRRLVEDRPADDEGGPNT